MGVLTDSIDTVYNWAPKPTWTTTTKTYYNTTWSCTSTCGSVCYAKNPITTASYTTKWAFRDYPRWSYTGPDVNCNFTDTRGPSHATDCVINGVGTARLFYWPVPKTRERDMCASAAPSVQFNITKPTFEHPYSVTEEYKEVTTGPSVVLNGTTFYSGNVYLHIPSIEFGTAGFATCGYFQTNIRGPTNVLLTMGSTQLESIRMGVSEFGWYGRHAVNYADLHPPYPWR